MNALEKAYNRSSSILSSVHSRMLDTKAANMMASMVSPAAMTGTDWQASSKNRESYSLCRSWVYSAINALASEAAGQPVNVGRMQQQQEEESKEKKLQGTKSYLLHRMPDNIKKKAVNESVEVIADHPLLKTFERPNPLQYRYQYVYCLVANLNLTGRAYIVMDEGENGVEYYAVPTTWIRPDHKDGPFSKFYVVNPRNMDIWTNQKPLDASQVAMIHLPNPADPMGALSPAQSVSAAIRVDDRIQTCQEKFFDNGIFPSVIVTVGRNPHPQVPAGIRPRLTGQQRRQVTGAIRRVMGGVANFGNPAIVDGLIESIERLSATQNELGWDKSEDKLKMRILSAFCVHPFILGEPLGVGGYSQTYNIEKRFCSRVNVFLDMISTVHTYFYNQGLSKSKKGEKASKERVLIWWDKLTPHDPSLDDANWRFARTNGDVSRTEYRAAKLGLPPSEEMADALISPTMLSGISGLLAAVGAGSIQPEQCQALLEGCGLPEELASKISVGPVQEPLDPTQGVPLDPIAAATDELKRAIAVLKAPQVSAETIVKQLSCDHQA